MTILQPIPMPSVYVVTGGPRHVKIGISVDVEQRMAQIQTGCPFRVKLVQSWETRDARKVEARAHTTLAKYRAMGEWFGIPAPVAVHTVSTLVESPNLGVLQAPKHAATFRCSKCGKRDRVHVIDF